MNLTAAQRELVRFLARLDVARYRRELAPLPAGPDKATPAKPAELHRRKISGNTGRL